MSLISLADLKTWMNIPADNTDYDVRLALYIDSISTALNTYTRRKLEADDYIEKYKGTDETSLILNQYPINSISEIVYTDGIGDESELIEDEDFEIEDADSGILYKETGWRREGYSKYLSGKINLNKRYIKVTYNAGFASDSIPSDLQMVAYEAVSNLFYTKESGANVIESKKVDDVSVKFSQGGDNMSMANRYFTSDQLFILNKYKKVD